MNYVDLSRLFVYFNERASDGTIDFDAGSSLRSGTQVLTQLGVCSEKEWPYIIEQYAIQPPQQCYTNASKHQILEYHRLNTLLDMKSCIAGGIPFVFGMSVYSSMMTADVKKTGTVPMPHDIDSLEGGHALLMVGYDDNINLLTFKNSWNTTWGDKGYGTLPYDYVLSGLVSDAWALVRNELDNYSIN
jgi:C1A family cysteine protease